MTSPPNEELAAENLRRRDDEMPDETPAGIRLLGGKERRLRSPRGSRRSAVK